MFSSRFSGVICCVALAALALAAPAGARDAYVANSGGDSVSVLNLGTGAPAGTIPVGSNPADVAITPDGRFVYVTNEGSDSVSVISTASNSVIATVPVGRGPRGVAISPDGLTAWVANGGDDTVTVIFTDTNTVSGGPIALPVGANPDGIAVSPYGGFAYVAQQGNDVSLIDTGTRAIVGNVVDPSAPSRIVIGPRGGRAFVTDRASGNVTAFNPGNGAVVGPIPIGPTPAGIAIAPNGVFAYAAALDANTVTPIATSTNAASPPIAGFNGPSGVAIAPNGAYGYVANNGANSVSVFSTVTNSVAGAIAAGANPSGLAIVPNQGPTAAFIVTPQRRLSRRRLHFVTGGSGDPDGTVANFAWDWGDGKRAQGPQTRRWHRYARPGIYTVTLTVTDNEGCSSEQVFTGQTASCNGTPAAIATRTITAIDPNGPVLRLAGGRRQRVRGHLNVFSRCPREACAVRAKGVVLTKFERRGEIIRAKRWLAPSRVSLSPGTWRKLRPRLRRGVRRGAIRALRRGGKATAKVTVIARDVTGQRTVRTRKVKLFFPRAQRGNRN